MADIGPAQKLQEVGCRTRVEHRLFRGYLSTRSTPSSTPALRVEINTGFFLLVPNDRCAVSNS